MSNIAFAVQENDIELFNQALAELSDQALRVAHIDEFRVIDYVVAYGRLEMLQVLLRRLPSLADRCLSTELSPKSLSCG